MHLREDLNMYKGEYYDELGDNWPEVMKLMKEALYERNYRKEIREDDEEEV